MVRKKETIKQTITNSASDQIISPDLITVAADRASTRVRLRLTPLGREVLAALLKSAIDEQDG